MNTIPTLYSQASFDPMKTYTPNAIGALGVGVADLRYERLNRQVIETSIHKDSGFSTYFFHTLIKQRLGVQLFIWTAGTGGIMTPHSTAELLNRLPYPGIHIEPSTAKQADTQSAVGSSATLSPAEHVANIRDVFAINMSDLASVLGVTRPTVYAWLAGQEPKGEAVIRIQKLSRVADQFNRANIIRLDKLVHRPILNGRSLLDILKTDEDPVADLATLKAIADKEAQTRREPKGSGKNLRSLDDVLSESSIAVYERS
jgi:DNA-binding transcriptional regulator YiaG